MFFQKDHPDFFIETIHKHFTGADPVFFDKKDFPWVADLESKAPQLIKSLEPLFADDCKDLQLNPEDRFQFPPKIWSGLLLYFYGVKYKKNLAKYPELAEVLSKIPNLISANISVLQPHSWLLPHNGASNGFVRCHLGLRVPAPAPICAFTIAGQEISWEEGKIFMFGDMNVHSAHNGSDKRRYVMILDVVRPQFLSIKKKICVHTIAKYYANVTTDYMRKPFNVRPPRVDQDPEKGLSYVPNEGYKEEEKLTIGQRIFRKIEDILLQIYIMSFWALFLFKKMQ